MKIYDIGRMVVFACLALFGSSHITCELVRSTNYLALPQTY